MQLLLQTITEYWDALGNFFAFDISLLAEPSMVLRLLLLFGLLFCSAFFSGSETALFSLSRLDLQQLRRHHNPQSETLHALLDQPFFVLNDVAYTNILKDLQSGARYVYSYAGLSSRPGYIDPKVPRFKNILGADGRSIERDVSGERRPVYSHAEFMRRFT